MNLINKQKSDLRSSLPNKGIAYAIQSLKEVIKEESRKYDVVILLESQIRELRRLQQQGVISHENFRLEENIIRKRVLDFINDIEEEDINSNPQHSRTSEPNNLKFNGLYQTQRQTTKLNIFQKQYNWQYLRFYEDGTVIIVSTSGDLPSISSWFHKDHPNVGRGNFLKEDDKVKFSILYAEGSVDYQGFIRDDGLTLELTSHSNINSKNFSKPFYFRAGY